MKNKLSVSDKKKAQRYVKDGPKCKNCINFNVFRTSLCGPIKKACRVGGFAVQSMGHCKNHGYKD